MKVLVACECSGVVAKAFRERGHEAWSCDLKPSELGEWHIHGDVRCWLEQGCWDLMIAHPECTHLCVSGARHFAAKRADGRQQAAIDFFMLFANANIPRIAIENPVGIMSTNYRKPDQIIQPWQFGHGGGWVYLGDTPEQVADFLRAWMVTATESSNPEEFSCEIRVEMMTDEQVEELPDL